MTAHAATAHAATAHAATARCSSFWINSEAMTPQTRLALVVAVCLLLVVAAFELGYEVGGTTRLRAHPGFERDRHDHAPV